MVPDYPVSRHDPSQSETPSEQLQTHANLSPHELEETLRRTEANLAWYRTLYESIPSIYFTEAVTIGLAYGISAYDASYVALCEQVSAPLLTQGQEAGSGNRCCVLQHSLV